jgi:hypothetical protein
MKKIAFAIVVVLLVVGWMVVSANNARTFGILSLNASHQAYLSVNGRRVNGSTPVTDLRLPPGEYDLRLVSPVVKKGRTVQVTIQAGQTTHCYVSFDQSLDLRRAPEHHQRPERQELHPSYVSFGDLRQ